MWRTDGGSGGGVRGREGCRWIKNIAVKGVGAFALADGDPRRSTESQKMARRKVSHGVVGLPLPWMLSTAMGEKNSTHINQPLHINI